MRGLSWGDESYVRLYRSDCASWGLLGHEGQSVYMATRRKLDRAGVLRTEGLRPAEAISGVLRWPLEFVESGFALCERFGYLVFNETAGCIVDPEFLASDEASRSSNQRQRDHRARRRALALAQSEGLVDGQLELLEQPEPAVTPGHAGPVTKRDIESRNVTGRDTEGGDESRRVTRGHSVPVPVPVPMPGQQPRAGAREGPAAAEESDRDLTGLGRLEAYAARVEDTFLPLAGESGLARTLNPQEGQLVERFWEDGIPLDLVLGTIRSVCERQRRAGSPVRSLRYFDSRNGDLGPIDQAWRDYQRLQAPAEAPPPEPELDVAARLERLARAIPAVEALAHLPDAIRRLADRDAETAEGELAKLSSGAARVLLRSDDELFAQATARWAPVEESLLQRLPADEVDRHRRRFLTRTALELAGCPELSLFGNAATTVG